MGEQNPQRANYKDVVQYFKYCVLFSYLLPMTWTLCKYYHFYICWVFAIRKSYDVTEKFILWEDSEGFFLLKVRYHGLQSWDETCVYHSSLWRWETLRQNGGGLG